MKKFDVVALGELLVDFTANGTSSQGNPLFEANPGGAPCNVLSMLQKLDKKTAFVGKVGEDSFGKMLCQAVEKQGIDTTGLVTDPVVPTTLAFVHTAPDGDRSFSFYRDPGADVMLREQDLIPSILTDTRIFHFGSLSMTHSQVEGATKKAIQTAKEAGAILSFDPNLRPPLWRSTDLAKEKIAYGISQCDVLKISDDEIAFFTGTEDIDEGISQIRSQYPQLSLVLATMGREGSIAYYKEERVVCEPFLNEKTIETTGAGDTFMACILNYVLEHDITSLNSGELQEMLTFANAAASLITTKKGALAMMPSRQEVYDFINK